MVELSRYFKLDNSVLATKLSDRLRSPSNLIQKESAAGVQSTTVGVALSVYTRSPTRRGPSSRVSSEATYFSALAV